MNKAILGALGAALYMCGSIATAVTFAEIGDAGDLPSTAQPIVGAGYLTSFSGVIQSATDVDMYLVFVDGVVPVTLEAAASTTIDSQIFVFDAGGFARVANDDLPTSLDASITTSLMPGVYYVAISAWDRDPVNAANQKIFSDTAGALQMPINGGGPVAGYIGLGGIGTYTINVTGVAAIPEPETYALMLAGLGLVGWAGRRQRRS